MKLNATTCPRTEGSSKNFTSKIKAFLIMLMLLGAANFSSAQTCADLHDAPSCNLIGPLTACLNGGQIIITTTIAISSANPTLVYTLPINTTGADIDHTTFVSYNATDSTYIETVTLNPGVNSGSINLQLDVTVHYSDGCNMVCECSKSITIVDLRSVLSSSPILCFGGTTCITAAGTGGSNFSYTLLPSGPTNSTGVFCGIHAGTYTVATTGTKSGITCGSNSTIVVTQPPFSQPSCNLSAPASPNCNSTGNQLCVSSDAASFAWNVNGSGWSITGGQGTNCITYTAGTGSATFTVTATSASGCTSNTCSTTFSCQAGFWGCTLGFWKNHTIIWDDASDAIVICLTNAVAAQGAPYSGSPMRNASFASTFGVTAAQMSAVGLSSTMTLLQALQLGGGGFKMMARQGTAALINTCGLSGHYTYNTSYVLTQIHNAIVTGVLGNVGNNLASANEVLPDNCPPAGRATKRLLNDNIIVNDNVTITAYPNPFSSQATIELTPTVDYSNVSVEIFNASGQRVSQPYNGPVSADQTYTWEVNGAGLAAGIYTYRIIAGDEAYNGKIVLMKN